jgi:hypothetical protein
MKRFVFLTILLLWMTGCAGVEISKITSENDKTKGVRFYRPWPYLMVTKNNGNTECKIVYLPKTNEEYAIGVKSGLGSVKTSFELIDGWQLTKFGDERDSKIPETINAITNAAKEAVAAQRSPVEEGLYRMTFKDGYVESLKRIKVEN